jgi:flagellar hook-associated protein 3 FlgL
MSTPRITQRLMVQHSLSSLQLGMNRLADTQEKLSTGRQINRPSDSPTGTNDAMRLRAQIAADDQHARNMQDGLAWMGTTDSAMSSMFDQVERARDLLVQGASTGNTSLEARTAIATELTQIRESLFGLANTAYLGRPIFGGATGSPVAYTKDAAGTVTYVGDATEVNRRIGDGVDVAINVVGTDALGNDASGLFAVLNTAITDLTTNPANLGSSLNGLDAVTEKLKTAQADLGTRYARIESAQTRMSSTTLDNKSALSDVENVDIAEAVMNLQLQQVAYQGALGATAQVIQRSLLDFLR